MGMNPIAKAEQVRSMLTVGAEAALLPEVEQALNDLYAVLDTISDDPSLTIAVLTVAAAMKGSQMATPGLEAEAEAMQIAMLRSVFATRQMAHRTLH